MARSSEQKLKMIYLLRIFEEYTDGESGITINEIVGLLEKKGVNAERKGLYDDIEHLRKAGYDIVMERKRGVTAYRMNSRLFKPAELKLLCDVIQTYKLITDKQSQALIDKVKKLCSFKQASKLQRSVRIADRPKSESDEVFDNIEKLNEAIEQQKLVDFEYYRWNWEGRLVQRNNYKKKNICPKVFEFNDGNYYLIAYDTEAEKKKHYRVDKIKKIRITDTVYPYEDEELSSTNYVSQMTGMFDGEKKTLRLRVDDEHAGIVIDKFGIPAVKIRPDFTAGGYICLVDVKVSSQLLGWLFGVSEHVELIGPDDVLRKYQSLLTQTLSRMSKDM